MMMWSVGLPFDPGKDFAPIAVSVAPWLSCSCDQLLVLAETVSGGPSFEVIPVRQIALAGGLSSSTA